MPEDLVSSYKEQAYTHLEMARTLYEHYEYPECIQSAQRCVELFLKAVLKKNGVEPPHKHDVGAELAQISDKISDSYLREKLAKLRFISLQLAMWRDPATYGLAGQVPPDKLFGKDEADLAIRYAEEARSACASYLY
ncbi:MAG: HEPN domain-containing protein [Dehalococcoidales bacterium]|nr:HEPN domain-containing protein [Dehalococcoidales bacterium]